MMSFDDINNIIDDVLVDKFTINILLAAFDGDKPEYKTMQTSKGVIATFKTMILDFLKTYKNMHTNGDLVFVQYEPGFIPQNFHLEYININETHFESIINDVPKASDIPVFDPSNTRFIERLKFYTLTLTSEKRRVLLFKRYSKTKELSLKGGLIVSWSGKQYDKVNESIFSFDNAFDCISINGVLYVFNKKNTEVIFKYYEELKNSAYSTIDKVVKHIPIYNLDAFKTDCSTHLHKLEKLRNISNKPYLPQLTMDNIRQIIDKYGIKVRIVNIDGKEMLEHDPTNKWAILNLLDDSYLSSYLTGNDYEVNSKIKLNKQSIKK